jgi:hypothetical protein
VHVSVTAARSATFLAARVYRFGGRRRSTNSVLRDDHVVGQNHSIPVDKIKDVKIVRTVGSGR